MNKRQNQTFPVPGFTVIALIMALVLCGGTTSADAAGASNAQQAAQIALQQSGGSGKVLGVNTETDSNGRRVFAVKILSNGRVRVVRIPQS
ncbi:MAG: hypothetical protein AB8B87_06125 [Granulosicoccus sp.]